MDESEDNMSNDDLKMIDTSSIKSKPKKRSLVERELETSLTARITLPVTSGDTSCTSRYGRARRRKTNSDFTDSDKTHAQWMSPPCEKTPVKLPSPAVHTIYSLRSPVKTEPKETPKKVISTESSLDHQIENIYHENISLSRFGSEEKPNKKSPGPKYPKVYVRTDLIQKREKEETVTMIKNIFSPVHSPYKTGNSHLNNVLERSAEKYNLNTSSKSHNGHFTPSVVKTLNFDSNKKRKKENRDGKTLSKSDLFDVEAKCQYQVGDLAWARMGTYPFWPSIVTREPDSGLFVKRKLFGRIERDLIHVTFFGDNGRRSWILETMLRKFLGQLEFQSTKELFSPSAKKKDPRLYAAFFISEKKLPQWNVSVEEAEALLGEPKRLRIDLLNDMLAKPRFNKSTPKSQKSNKIIRTASDVSLSESLYDTLFSEDDGKVEDPESSRSKLRTSLDVSEVVTACLDNMAAKTGITKIQRQSHMDRWLQKAKSKTPEKLLTKVTPPPKEKEVKVISSKKKKFPPALNLKRKPYSFRKHVYESHNLRSHHNEHDYSSQLNDSAHNDSAIMAGYGIGFITKVESLRGKESVENEELQLKTEDIDASDSDSSKNIENDNTHASENIGLGPIISADDTLDEVQVNMCTLEENAELENTLDTEKVLKVVDPSSMVLAASLEKATTDLVLTKVIDVGGQKVSKVMQSDSEIAETISTSKYQLRSAKVDSEEEIKDEICPMTRRIGYEISDLDKRMSYTENDLEKVPGAHFINKIEKPKVNLNEIIQLMQVDCKKQSESSLNVPEKASKNYLRKQITNSAVNITELKETNSVKHVMNTKDAQENKKEIKCNQEEDNIINVDIKEDQVIVGEVKEDNTPANVEVQSETMLADSKKHTRSLKTVQNNYEMKEQTGFADHASDIKVKENKRSSLRNAKKKYLLENNKNTDLEKDTIITMVRLKNQIEIKESEQGNISAKITKEKSAVDISDINLDAQMNVTPVQVQAQYEPVKVLAGSDLDVKNQGGVPPRKQIHRTQKISSTVVLDVSDKNVIDNESKLKKTEKNKNTDLAKNIDSRKASFDEENDFDEKYVNVYESVYVDVKKQKDTVRKSDRKEKEKKAESRKPKDNKLNKIKIKIVSPRDKPIQPTQLPSVKEPATTHQIESIDLNVAETNGTLLQSNQSKIEIIPLGSEQKPIDTKVIPQHSTMLNVSDKNVIDNESELRKTEKTKNTDLTKNTDSRKASLEKIVEENNFDKQDTNVYESVHAVEKQKDAVRKSDRIEKEKKTESSKLKKNKLNKIKIKIVSPRDKPTQPTQLTSVKGPATTHHIESIESKVTEKKGTLVQLNQNGMEIIPLASEQKPIDTKVIPIEDIEYGHLDFIFSTSPEKNSGNELDNAVAIEPVLQNESLVSINTSKVSDEIKNSLSVNNCEVNATVSLLNKHELRVSVEKMCFSNYSDCKIVNGPIESFAKFKKTNTSNTSIDNDMSEVSFNDDLNRKLELNDSFEEKTDSVESVTVQTLTTVCDSMITPNRPIDDSVPNGELKTDDVSTPCVSMNNKQDCAVITIETLQYNEYAKMSSFKENGNKEHTIEGSVYEIVTPEPAKNNEIKCDVLDNAEEKNKSLTSVDVNTFIEPVNRLPEPVKVNGFYVDECLDFSDGEINAETSSINSEDSEPLSITRIKQLSKNRGKVQKALGNPEFVKYMELRQDALMDEHPELSQDEIVEYLFKTWDYEQNTKSDVAKNDDIEQSGLVKGLDNLRQKTIRNSFKRRNKKGDEDTVSINSDVSDTSAKRRFRTEVKSPAVPFKEDAAALGEDHILKIKKELDTSISVSSDFSDDINKNLQSNDSKMLEVALDSEIHDISITSPKQKYNDCEKTSPTKGKTEEKRLKINYVKEKSKSPTNSNNNSIKNYFTDLDQPTKPAKSIGDVQIEFDSQKEIKEECNLDTVSLNSEVSLTDLPLSKRKQRKYGEKQNYKTIKDPEFSKYVELRQDILIDENPQLTHDEIVAYLYKTWLYEENAKSAIKKSDDIEQANLVKGLNQDAAPPKKVRKRIKAENDSDCEDDIPIAKDKPKRKICPAYYNENIYDLEDIEDEIELFEIFKPKNKLNLFSPKSEDIKSEVKTELAKQDKDTAPEIDPDVIDLDEYDEVELYFSQLCEPKPNVFKGLVRERVCEICEKTGNLIKCKGCHCMFHDGCAKKAAEVFEPPAPATRGRKKKKKPGRKPKNLEDSESHSDEKSHDASLELNVSADDDFEPRTVNEDDFETLLTNKMKELIPDEVNYESYSSDECLDWNTSAPGKCEIIDIKLKPKIVTDYANFKCRSCEKFSIPVCFVCKEAVSKNGVDVRQKCQTAHCHKYYHLECLDHWPQTQFNGGEPSKTNKKINEHFETLMCPRHVCHTCVSDDPRGCKTRFSGDKLARCVKCPATYHSFTKCLPAGTQILTGSLIVCPRHYEHRPGKVPCHVNTGWCFICALGGSLICCEYCPTSFHAECLNISPPEGGYMCEDCETGRLPLYGEMVWVKLGHYRWWPGLILHPSEIPANIMAVKHSPGEFVVRFFGQYDHYWVNRGRVFPFQEGDSGRVSGQKSKIDAAFTTAMEHAQRACAILKAAEPNEEESLDIASSLLPPRYVKLKVNKPCGSLCGRKIDIEESSLTQCECNPDEENPCGPYSHCLNRMLLTECGPICRAAERCSNRQFEKRLYPKMTPYRTPHRGWGLKTLEDIKAGQFVIEYVGELIDEEEFRRRMNRMHEIRDENFYFLTLDKERMIDAGPKGNLARFMNHCCEPNCETQKWTVLGDVRVGLFALYDIPANSELTFNYNLECAGIDKKRCMCGARRCSGYIGAKPKQDEPQVKKNKRTYKKRKNVDQSPSTSLNKPKRPVGRPAKPRELTDIEKDLLIIKNATNGISSDSEGSSRLSSIDSEKHPRALKRKRVSFSTEDAKRVKVDDLTDVKRTEGENSEMSGMVTV